MEVDKLATNILEQVLSTCCVWFQSNIAKMYVCEYFAYFYKVVYLVSIEGTHSFWCSLKLSLHLICHDCILCWWFPNAGIVEGIKLLKWFLDKSSDVVENMRWYILDEVQA